MTAILIHSWDNNKKLWPVTAHAFKKYWADCPYPIYFITNYEDAPIGTTLKIGKECGFASNTLKALEQIEADTIIWTLEDYWFSRAVNTALVKRYVKHVEDGNADYIRLFTSDNALRTCEFDETLNYFNDDCIYKTSLGTSIWKKSLLQRLITVDEDIWQFEMHSAARTFSNEKFLTVNTNECMSIAGFHLMEKNLLTASGHSYIINEGIKL